jgi:hypothetical protein
MKNRKVFWSITIILSVLILYVAVCNVIIPVVTKSHLLLSGSTLSSQSLKEDKVKKEDTKKKPPIKATDKKSKSDSIFVNSTQNANSKLFNLRKSEEFLASRINLVNNDSSYLVLDLMNKMFILELKGISLYECHVVSSQINSSIKDLPAASLLSWIAEPFYLKHSDATITRASLKEMIAPKDTVEANKKDETPRAPKRNDAYIVMDFERNLRLIIRQSEKPDKEGARSIDSLQWKYRKIELINNLQALIHIDRDMVKPTIEIVLPKEDATILYRALPRKAKLLLRI